MDTVTLTREEANEIQKWIRELQFGNLYASRLLDGVDPSTIETELQERADSISRRERDFQLQLRRMSATLDPAAQSLARRERELLRREEAVSKRETDLDMRERVAESWVLKKLSGAVTQLEEWIEMDIEDGNRTDMPTIREWVSDEVAPHLWHYYTYRIAEAANPKKGAA